MKFYVHDSFIDVVFFLTSIEDKKTTVKVSGWWFDHNKNMFTERLDEFCINKKDLIKWRKHEY